MVTNIPLREFITTAILSWYNTYLRGFPPLLGDSFVELHQLETAVGPKIGTPLYIKTYIYIVGLASVGNDAVKHAAHYVRETTMVPTVLLT